MESDDISEETVDVPALRKAEIRQLVIDYEGATVVIIEQATQADNHVRRDLARARLVGRLEFLSRLQQLGLTQSTFDWAAIREVIG